MSDPKEALERLKLLEAESRKGVPKITATRAPILAADLRALISDRDRLEGEMERLTKWGNERHAAAREAMDTAYHLQYPPSPELLENIAERIDCGGNCETAWQEWDTNATGCTKSETDGCPFEEAENLRDFAKALRTQALAHHSAPVGEAESAEAYNARFDPANEAGQETFDAGWKCGWMFARFDGCWDDEAEEVYRREADSVAMGEAWEAHRDDFFARLPLAAVDRPAPVPAPVPAEEGGEPTDAYAIIAEVNRRGLMLRAGVRDRSRDPLLGPPDDMAVSRVLLAERPDFDPKEADRLAVKITDVLRLTAKEAGQ